MDLKKLLEQIRSELTDEQKSTLTKTLSAIESGFSETQTELQTARDDLTSKTSEHKEVLRESIQRKNKIRTIEAEIVELKDDTTVDTLKKENETLKTYQEKVQKGERSGFITRVKSYKDNENFKKAVDSGIFKLPDIKNGDGKLDIGKMTDDDWTKIEQADMDGNVDELDKLEKIGYFGGDGKPIRQVPDQSRQSHIKPDQSNKPVKSRAELTEKVKQNLNDYQK